MVKPGGVDGIFVRLRHGIAFLLGFYLDIVRDTANAVNVPVAVYQVPALICGLTPWLRSVSL